MDSKRFDALTRGFGAQRTRRDAVKAFAGGLMGLGVAKSATAQVSIERATCGQSCSGAGECNSGLRCSRPTDPDGLCVAIEDSDDQCNENRNCGLDYEVCRNGNCVNQSNCSRCNENEDCPGDQICRRGNCGRCERDRDCPGNEVCRNGRCERDRDECNSNSDCPRRQRCRRGRCERRN